MHLLYEDLPHQRAAIDAVCDLFRGQEISRAEFTVTLPADQLELTGVQQSDLGIGNRISNTADDYLLANLREIQLRNSIPQDDTLAHDRNFDVEMETGTGKTYVYLSTIYELNQRFGFTKFVIVVPSVAIKEGVGSTLRDTAEHFRRKYNQLAHHFVYDSGRLSAIRDFATSKDIEIMVATVQSLYGGRTIFNNPQEKLAGEKPLDVVASTNPILIVDEPQSVEGLGTAGREALKALRPLVTLRYSATHIQHHHTVYKLDAVDAYEQRLVKQIEVASLLSENDHNRPYIKLLRIEAKNKPVRAQLDLDCERVNGIQREPVWVYATDPLDQATNRSLYADHVVDSIRKKSRDVAGSVDALEIRVPGATVTLTPEEPVFGDVDEGALSAAMIRRTIKAHLDKEKRMRPRGIKVLSLFFIRRVEDYRLPDGSPGPYAAIFEQEYARLSRLPEYNQLFEGVDVGTVARDVHNGYFSIDREKKLITPFEGEIKLKGNNQDTRDTETYNLIMREKTRLLDLKTPLKFIFSHSALREGWDNPNVFQLCAFREMNQERERRQTIGRGLRLCVNQQGERIRGFETNTLTVIANESYQSFAEKLQKDILDETGIRFGVVNQMEFATLQVHQDGEPVAALGKESSQKLWDALRQSGYLDNNGKVTEALKKALDGKTLQLPTEFEAQRELIEERLTKISAGVVIRDADEERPTVRLREAVLNSAEFRQLWDRIRTKSTYRVHFDPELLVQNCVRAIQREVIAPPTFITTTTKASLGRGGLSAGEATTSVPEVVASEQALFPDIIRSCRTRHNYCGER